MKLEVFADAQVVARRGAERIAAAARAAVAARGRFALALSGGRTPWAMLRALAGEDVPWPAVHVFQVDERIAPAGDPDRNLTNLRASLMGAPLAPEQIHPMPVEGADLEAAAREYARMLPPVFDLIHLGVGTDGHTASLVPGDAVLQVADRDVALSGPYQERRRMTLTYPALDRARQILWLVTGADKAAILVRLHDGDRSIPAGRVRAERARALVDRAAAAALERT